MPCALTFYPFLHVKMGYALCRERARAAGTMEVSEKMPVKYSMSDMHLCSRRMEGSGKRGIGLMQDALGKEKINAE